MMAGHPSKLSDFRTQLNGLLSTLEKLPVGERESAINLLQATLKGVEGTEPSTAREDVPEPAKYFFPDSASQCPGQEEASQGSESEFDQHPEAESDGQDIDDDLCLNHEVPESQVHPHPAHLKHSIEENLSFNILHQLSETDCLDSTLTESEAANTAELSHKASIPEKQHIATSNICSKVKTKNGYVGERQEDGMAVHMAAESPKTDPGKRALYHSHSDPRGEAQQDSSQQHACLENLGKYDEILDISEQDRLLGTAHGQVSVPMLAQTEQHLALITSRDFCEGGRGASDFGVILHTQDHPERELPVLEDHTGHSSHEFGSAEPLLQLRIKNAKQDRNGNKLNSCDKSNSFDENSCNSINLSHFHGISERDSIYSEDNSYLLPYLERDHYEKIEYKLDIRKSNVDGFGRPLEASASFHHGTLDGSKTGKANEDLDQDKTPVDLSSTSNILHSVKLEECMMALQGSPAASHQPQGIMFSSEPSSEWDKGISKSSEPMEVEAPKQKRRLRSDDKQRSTIHNTNKQESSIKDKLMESPDISATTLLEGDVSSTLDLSSSVLLGEAIACDKSGDNQDHSFEANFPTDVERSCSAGGGGKALHQEDNSTLEYEEEQELPSNLEPVSCRTCKKMVPDVSLFTAHQRQCESHFVCTICQAKFTHKVTYTRHMEGHRRNVCSKCSQSFCSHKKLKAHMKTEHNFDLVNTTFPCQMCSRCFQKRSSLYYHLKVHAAEDEEVCQQCGAFLKGQEAFTQHMADHAKATKFHCHICTASFKRRQQYNDHLTHHKKNRCEFCSQPFTTKRALIRHCRHEHKTLPQHITLDRQYKCDKCDRIFNRPSLLRHHLQLHRGIKLECRLCNKQFSHRRGLRKHMNSVEHEHTLLSNNLQKDHAYDVKQNYAFTCDYCGLKLPTRYLLTKHNRTAHKMGVTWNCPHCDYTSKRNHTLKRHMELHLESRNFMCEICGSSFQALATLKDHYNFVHSDERNYKCNECDKSFKNKSSLARHCRTHSDDRPYKCHCGTTYKRLSHLKRHSSTAHKEVLKSRAVKKLKKSDDTETGIDDANTLGQHQRHSKEFSEEGEGFEFIPVSSTALSPGLQTDAAVKGTADILLPTPEGIILMGENSSSDEGHLITVADSQIIQLIPSTFQFPQDSTFQTVSLVSTGDLHAIPLSTPATYTQGGHSSSVVVEPFTLSQSSEAMVMVPASHPLGADSDAIPTALRTLDTSALTEPVRAGREVASHAGIKRGMALPTLDGHTELAVSPELDTYDYSGAAASPQTSSLLPALPPPHFITHAHSHTTAQDMLQPSLIISDLMLPVEGNR